MTIPPFLLALSVGCTGQSIRATIYGINMYRVHPEGRFAFVTTKFFVDTNTVLLIQMDKHKHVPSWMLTFKLWWEQCRQTCSAVRFVIE